MLYLKIIYSQMETKFLPQSTSCEVCGNPKLDKVLELGSHPLCDDLTRIYAKGNTMEFPINILFCKNCNTAHQD
jgi:hypothetical protein